MTSFYLRPEEDQSIQVKMSARFSACFYQVQKNLLVFMQQPAEKLLPNNNHDCITSIYKAERASLEVSLY